MGTFKKHPAIGILAWSAVMAATWTPACAMPPMHQDENYADLSLEELMKLEVTSVARKSQHLADVAAAGYVITHDDIRHSGAHSLPEALRLAPGVDAAHISGDRWAVSIRGFNGQFANKLLVLVDGRSVYSPAFSGVFWDALNIPLSEVERIEVVRGPGAAVWGANAVNGVINVITKAAAPVLLGAWLESGQHINAAGSNSLARRELDEAAVRRANRIGLKDFDPCVVLLNNDLSAGIPAILENIEQQVIPPLFAGWSTRRKSQHFAAYSKVAAEFAELIDIDPWLVDPYFAMCGEINFQERTGEECLAGHVEGILGQIRKKYQEYGIDREPFVIVKADAGTYGMGIMSVKDPSEVRDLNRKQRTKMAVVKEGLAVTDALVQEGVYTFETVNEAVAEPVIYMIDQFVVGGFYRVHTERGPDENLNAPGMHFEPMPFDTACLLPDPDANPDCPPNRFYAYGVIARLALVAAALELEQMAEVYEEAQLARLPKIAQA